jgi:hypothetical protein
MEASEEHHVLASREAKFVRKWLIAEERHRRKIDQAIARAVDMGATSQLAFLHRPQPLVFLRRLASSREDGVYRATHYRNSASRPHLE